MNDWITLIAIGVGLAMDAFSVAICKGLAMKRVSKRQTLLIGLFFGGFQALMPFLGWLLASSFAGYVKFLAPWISFALLLFLGGRMIFESRHPDNESTASGFSIRELLTLSLATSIDALAMGVTFSLDGTNIFAAIAIIGIITFVLSVFGVLIGHHFGSRYSQNAELAGGVILCLIGVKILLEHLLTR